MVKVPSSNEEQKAECKSRLLNDAEKERRTCEIFTMKAYDCQRVGNLFAG